MQFVQAAKEAKGANARAKDLTVWKRNVCNGKFSQLSREEQVVMLPEFAEYHADEDACEAVASSAASASSVPAALPEPAGLVQAKPLTLNPRPCNFTGACRACRRLSQQRPTHENA